MCDCEKDHPNIECGSMLCLCHRDTNNDDVYVSVTFSKISRVHATALLKIITEAAGLTSYGVYINDAQDDEDEE